LKNFLLTCSTPQSSFIATACTGCFLVPAGWSLVSTEIEI